MSTPKGYRGAMNVSMPKHSDLIKKLHRINKDGEDILKKTVCDFKSRAPAWVSAAVSETYGIPKSEVKNAFAGTKKSASRIKVAGNEIDNVGLVYSGRRLTPTHFKMKPANPPSKKGVPYQISAEFFKGKRQRLSSRAFLIPIRFRGESGKEEIKSLPFQRKGKGRWAIKTIRTLSIPQMLTNKTVAAAVQENINAGLGKRVEHHMSQALKRNE